MCSRPTILCAFVLCAFVLCLTAALCPAADAPANLAPLGIQGPDLVPMNQGDLEMTLSYISGYFYPFQRWDVNRTLVEMPSVRVNLGLGERAELQLHLNYLYANHDEMNGKQGIGDLTMGAKIRLLKRHAPYPPLSMVFATKLPNADDSRDLGTDQTDFFVMAVSSYTCEDFTFYLNLGLDILADPVYNHSGQDDLFRYGLGVRTPITPGLDALASIEGLNGEAVNKRGVIRLGLQYSAAGPWTWHLGYSSGYRDLSEDWSIRAGFVRHFSIPETW